MTKEFFNESLRRKESFDITWESFRDIFPEYARRATMLLNWRGKGDMNIVPPLNYVLMDAGVPFRVMDSKIERAIKIIRF